ncbi:Leo1-like protein-domain-containing protein [Filobasidium floriforme]|uniref:Leo1-like protein-domain-containing protein n=1 Tax=Filobasidium floriforme TaxID=5210 RepID=UPI001E8E77C6|nr:Leo1-like protein-domain-containing protein [Filobasidium floriforme]KAH8084156.1 Leo1-like protein-domain-containing protein [Filobasidium floriforme]
MLDHPSHRRIPGRSGHNQVGSTRRASFTMSDSGASSPLAPARNGSPAASPKREDGLADMFDDFQPQAQPQSQSRARSTSRTPSPARSTTDSPVKRNNRSLSRTSSRSSGSGDEDDRRARMEYGEEENTNAIEQTILESNIVLPKVPKLASSDGQVWALKLPPAISFPAQPFHPDLYRSEEGPKQEAEDAEDTTDEARRIRALKRMHSVANTVRWKWKDGTHGEPVRRSNARVIRWSDGTASLMVGQEMWDLQVDSVAGSGPEAKATRPFALAKVAAEAKAKAEANQDGSQSQSQSQSQFLASQSSQPKRAIDGSIAKPRATREGPVSLLLSTDFDDQVLIADSLITGSMSLVPQTRNVRDHQKRLAAVSKSTVKASRIQAYRDSSGIRPDKKIEESVREMNEAQKKRMKARGHDVNAGLSLPVWKGSSGTMRERETSPLGAAGGRKSRGPSGPRKGRTSYSSDEDMDDDGGRGGGGGYTGGDYEEDDFVVDDDEDERADQSGSEVSAAESNGLSALDRDLDREERGDRSSRTSKPKRPKKSSRDYESDEDDDPLDAMERAAEENAQAQRREAKERRKREKERQKEERAGESRWLRSRTVLMPGW